ncbi:unnamed protein product [Staurois parvus]|uniref:Uncharacterized protein n=1 Tax=Staurois parvus TaxID=386267 RepID=A0ABN9GEM0_9NEOB|nr:unnamed protein product [Staurois parvus]
MYIHRNTHAQTHVHTHRHMYIHTQTHTCTRTHTHPPIESCSTSLFTHRAGYCTLGGGKRAQHTLLPLLSLCSAIEQSDGSQCQ